MSRYIHSFQPPHKLSTARSLVLVSVWLHLKLGRLVSSYTFGNIHIHGVSMLTALIWLRNPTDFKFFTFLYGKHLFESRLSHWNPESFTHKLTGSLTHWLTDSLTHWLSNWDIVDEREKIKGLKFFFNVDLNSRYLLGHNFFWQSTKESLRKLYFIYVIIWASFILGI